MTQGPQGASLPPEAIGEALAKAAPYLVALAVVGWLLHQLPL